MIERDEVAYDIQSAALAAEADLKRPKRGRGLDSFAKRFAKKMAKRGFDEAEAEVTALLYCGEAVYSAVCAERDELRQLLDGAKPAPQSLGNAVQDAPGDTRIKELEVEDHLKGEGKGGSGGSGGVWQTR